MIEIQHSPTGLISESEPLTWCRFAAGIWLVCRNGHGGYLDHEIADDGTVTPSLVCPSDGCTFHEFVRLEGWEE